MGLNNKSLPFVHLNYQVLLPNQGDVYIAKKVLGKFVKLPCVDNFGSCTYPDLCLLLEQVQCPDPIVRIGIDCMCPLKAVSLKAFSPCLFSNLGKEYCRIRYYKRYKFRAKNIII